MEENWVGGKSWRECAWRYGTVEFGSVCIDLLKHSGLAIHLTRTEYRLPPPYSNTTPPKSAVQLIEWQKPCAHHGQPYLMKHHRR